MDIEDVFGDYQNGNYNVGASNAANDFLTSTEGKNGGGANPGGSDSGQKPPKPPKQKKKGGAGIIVFLLFVLILVGAAGFVYFKTDLLKFASPRDSFMNTIKAGVEEYKGLSTTAISKINTDGDMNIKGSIKSKAVDSEMKYEYSFNKKDGYMGINVENLIDVIVKDNTAFIGDSSLSTDKKYIGIRNENLDKVYENFSDLGSSLNVTGSGSETKVPDSITLTADDIKPSAKVKNNISNIISNDFSETFSADKFTKDTVSVGFNGEEKQVTRYTLKTTKDDVIDFVKNTYNDVINDKDVKEYLDKIGLYDYFKTGTDKIDSDDSPNVNEVSVMVYESKGTFAGFRFETDNEDYYEILKTAVTDSSITYEINYKMNEEDDEPEKGSQEIVVNGSEVGYSISTRVKLGDDEGDTTRTAISNISPEGYEYSFESTSGASSIIVSGKVKYEVSEDDMIEVSEDEAYMLNDAESDEDKENVSNFISAFVMKIIFGGSGEDMFSGGGTSNLYPDDTNTVTNTVVDPTNTIIDTTNTVLDVTNTVIDTIVEDVTTYPLYSTVVDEVKTVLTACITESQNNQMDITNYLNVENLTGNCPSILSASLDKVGDSKFEGILIDTEGKQYKLVIDVDGFSSLTFDIVNP